MQRYVSLPVMSIIKYSNFFSIIVLFFSSISLGVADDFSYQISKAGKFYGDGNVQAAYYWYIQALNSADSKERLLKTLPALATTSMELGYKAESIKYLEEFDSLYPNHKWTRDFVEKYSLFDLSDDLGMNSDRKNQTISIVVFFTIIFLVIKIGEGVASKLKIKRKRYFNNLHILFSIIKSMKRVKSLMNVIYNKPPVFISYSRQDKKFLDELKEHLSVYERQGLIEYWDDSKIQMGSLWRLEITQALKSAKIAILLVSRPYLASKFIVNNELPPLLSAAKKQDLEIIPIMVSHCPYDISELGKIQASNCLLKPLKNISPAERDVEYLKVLDRVAELLKD